jgi:hypothetical protein
MWETAIDPQFQTKIKTNQPTNQTYFALSGVQKTELGYKAQISRVIGRGKHVIEEEKRRLYKPGMKSMPKPAPFSIFLNSSTTRRRWRCEI